MTMCEQNQREWFLSISKYLNFGANVQLFESLSGQNFSTTKNSDRIQYILFNRKQLLSLQEKLFKFLQNPTTPFLLAK